MRRVGFNKFLFIAALSSIVACTPQETFKATDVHGVDWGGDFALTTHSGTPFKSSDVSGKLLVLFFGYTHCPDICAPTLVKLAQVQRRLEADAERVQVVFITVDPKHDNPAQLAGFVPSFHPSFIGLTGTESQIATVAKQYNVPSEREMNHSGVILVKDMQGRMRLVIKNEASVDDILHDLRLLLRQSG
jgi:protein SCO1/2